MVTMVKSWCVVEGKGLGWVVDDGGDCVQIAVDTLDAGFGVVEGV